MTARPCLVLLPGMPLDAALWDHQIRHLAEVAEPVVGDVSGHDTMAGLAGAVLQSVPDGPFLLAGLSLGGYVALEIMRQAPHRVTKLALLDTSARPDTPEQTVIRRQAVDLARQGRYAAVVAASLPRLLHPDRLSDAGMVASVQDQAARVGPAAYARQQQAIIGRPDSRPGLSAIACPTLVLCGRQDAITPVDIHREIAAAVPGARLAVVEECGHLAPMERPHVVTGLLRDWILYR